MDLVSLGVGGAVRDARSRPLRDLRISVTDRCNFRCPYCMPAERFGPRHEFLPSSALLSFDELERLARAAVALGVEKLRLTGGEPLLRQGIPELVARLARIEGVKDLALTTNGAHLARLAPQLASAGLSRVTVSLDSLDDEIFGRMNGVGAKVATILGGIDAAKRAGIGPIKINMVVRRGFNDGSIVPMARHFRGTGITLRFIEYMDVGATNGWSSTDVVPGSEVIDRIANGVHALEPIDPAYAGEVARRFRYTDGSGEVGIISSVSEPFCGSCSRARLTADGMLYTCLFARSGHDLRSCLRSATSDGSDVALVDALRAIWSSRDDRYSELRGQEPSRDGKVEMSLVGG